ncbi:hypothetical protein P691DRAFT_803992 [Macrolepiota fuliginosa MF-IS2]|uniref:Mid2 domain-containing protein n=1 Tax=Macrolepiota fuliginosa MF-IS2 TaxID=1400762 RepID=A0A9P6BZL3_9AGAR|nr:hypothetical protein P691DRAFT_803992 [Macrolepiota fuliginosa MF-IS2]
MISFRAILNFCFVASLARAAVVLERQVVSTHPISLVPGTPITTQDNPSLTKTVTKTVVTTSTISPFPPDVPIVSSFVVTYTHSGQISLSTATVTLVPTSLSTFRSVPAPFAATATPTAEDLDSSRNKGAIAGGVLGALAVVLAAFAAFIWFRRRSPKHWRNRTAGRWQNLDNKDASGAGAPPVYVGAPVHRTRGDVKQPNPNPLPPLYIRDRQPAADLFADVPGSPTSPRLHMKSGSTSSAAHQRHDSSGRFDIELQPAANSPPQ